MIKEARSRISIHLGSVRRTNASAFAQMEISEFESDTRTYAIDQNVDQKSSDEDGWKT